MSCLCATLRPAAPARGLTLAVVSAAILFDALDLSITQVALPSIRADLGLSTATLPWVAGAYVLTYGGLLLLGGRAADLLGRRRVFVAGLALFAAMSLACGLAPSGAILIASRAVQGVGAALTVPAAVAIIATTFAEGPERNRALGVFGASGSAGFSVGLVAGGLLTDLLDWRWIFLMKVPVVTLAALAALRAIAADGPARAAGGRSYDVPGAVLGATGLLALVFGITELAHGTVPPAVLGGAAVLSVAALAGFVGWEARATDPLLPLAFFRLPVARVADLASLTVLAAPFGFAYVATLYMQEVRGDSPLATGLALLPGGVGSVLVSRWGAPALIGRIGLRAAGSLGLLLVGAGFALLVRLDVHSSYAAVLLPASIVSLALGMGVAYPAFTIGGVTGVPAEQQGLAAGIQSTALQVGGGLGLALVAAGIAGGLGPAPHPGAYVAALHVGAAIGAALPLAGAAVTLAGLRQPRPAA